MNQDAENDFKDALDAINRELAAIKAGVALARRRAYREGVHWGHAGSMRHIANQLSEINEGLEDWNGDE